MCFAIFNIIDQVWKCLQNHFLCVCVHLYVYFQDFFNLQFLFFWSCCWFCRALMELLWELSFKKTRKEKKGEMSANFSYKSFFKNINTKAQKLFCDIWWEVSKLQYIKFNKIIKFCVFLLFWKIKSSKILFCFGKVTNLL